MRSALVALAAAATFFVGAFELEGGGSERPLPARIDAGEGRTGAAPPSESSFTVAGFEVIPSLIREEPLAEYETSQTETAVAADERSPSPAAARERSDSTPAPEPTPTPSDTSSQTPTASPSPSQSPVE
jgi:hypothetical protein